MKPRLTPPTPLPVQTMNPPHCCASGNNEMSFSPLHKGSSNPHRKSTGGGTMKISLVKITFAFLCLGFHSGCNYNIDKTGGGQDLLGSSDGSTLGFDAVFQAVIGPKCATCHSSAQGNRGGINLETYENVFAHRTAMQGAIEDGFMPPRSGVALTAQERSALLGWLAAGAPRTAKANPNTPPSPAPGPQPPSPPGGCLRVSHDDHDDDDDHDRDHDDDCAAQPVPPQAPPAPGLITFSMVYEQVLAPRCVSCHGDRGGINLETYENVFANRQAIVDAVSDGIMPPRSRGPLTPEQQDLLMRWIQSGAPFSNQR